MTTLGSLSLQAQKSVGDQAAQRRAQALQEQNQKVNQSLAKTTQEENIKANRAQQLLNQEKLDLAKADNQRAQQIFDTQEDWINTGQQISTAVNYLRGVNPQDPESFNLAITKLIQDDNGVDGAAVAKLNLTPDNYQETVMGIMDLHQQEGVQRGYIRPQQAPKRSTTVRTVMQDGVPQEVLFDSETGDPIRILGQAKPTKEAVSVNVGEGESAFAKELGKLAGQEVNKLRGVISKSEEELRRLDQLKDLDQELGESFYRGLSSGVVGVLGRVRDVLRLDPDKLSAAEALTALNNELAFGSREPGSGTFTDADFERYSAIYSNLGDTPEGFRKKLALKEDQLEYKQRYAQARQDALLQTNGNITQANNIMKTWKKNNPFRVPKANSNTPSKRDFNKEYNLGE